MDPADEEPVVLDDFKVHGGIDRVRVTLALLDPPRGDHEDWHVGFPVVEMTPTQARELAADLNAQADRAESRGSRRPT